MIILVLNCGSSSLKYQLLDMKNDDVYSLMAKGLVERIGMDSGHLVHKVADKEPFELTENIPDHTTAVKLVLAALTDKGHGVLESLSDIEAVGHRVLHGGREFFRSELVTPNVIEGIRKCCEIGPLHNPANLMGIEAVSNNLPDVPQVTVFDTAFHQTMPDYNYLYGLPYEYYEKYGIRRYGFHGTSHKFVSAKGAAFAGLDLNNSKIITCHLGNGSSITAVENGKSIDTSMGFSPLEGVLMGTRCGNIDTEAACYIMNKEGLTPTQMSRLLNKESGLLGVSGVSSDCRDCGEAAAEGNERAKIALKMLAHGVIKYIGAFAAQMNGVDLIVFTGGIGENNVRMRRRICENLDYLGVKFDHEANDCHGIERMISLPDSKVKVAVIPTNEELMIARDTMNIVNSLAQ